MKRAKILSMFSLIIAIMLTASSMAYASLERPVVYVNDQKLDIFAGLGTAGVTYVPFRPIFEKFNMNVSWAPAQRQLPQRMTLQLLF